MTEPPLRVAALDCGTNSVRLLITDLDPADGTASEVTRQMRIVRLGEDIDRTGRIAEAALERCFAALDEYAAMITEHGVTADHIRFCATSAARDAENAAVLATGVTARLGVAVEVLPGIEEARLSFAGAVRALPDPVGPVLVFDIGGGSTELVLGRPDGTVTARGSLDIGSVRLTERHLHDDPPTDRQISALLADVDAAWAADPVGVDLATARTVVGVAGTITTVAAGVLGLDRYDRDRIHLARLDIDEVHRHVGDLVEMSVAERRSLGYMHPGRADVIGGGALILDRLLRHIRGGPLIVSEADILDGMAWSLAP